MATILLTGASGFIGGQLAGSLCRQGHHVRCLVRPTSVIGRLRDLGAELVAGDVTQPDCVDVAIRGVDVVYSLAGLRCALRNADLLQVNRDGIRHVAQACADQPRPPIHIVVSSVAAGGPAFPGQLQHESREPFPISNYGRSKLAGELAARELAQIVPTTIVRPGIVFGEWNRELLPLFRSIGRWGVHVVAGWRPPPLSLIHVADLVPLLQAAAERGVRVMRCSATSDEPGRGIYHANDPETPDYAEFGRMIGKALGRRRTRVVHIPGLFPWLVGAAGDLVAQLRRRPMVLGIDKIREALAPSWACSAEAAQRGLAFAPPQPLAERLRETVAWYRQQRWI